MTHNKKPLAAGLAALVLSASLVPVQARQTTYRDIEDSAWYTPYAAFCQQHQLMDGLTASTFAPDTLMTRATLAEALYRLAGRPAVEPPAEPSEAPDDASEEASEEQPADKTSGEPEEAPDAQQTEEASEEDSASDTPDTPVPLPEDWNQPFPDVGPDHPNLDAIRWAKLNDVVSGYPNGLFGPDDPITREQIAVLLWSNRGWPEAASAAPYADRASIADWSAGAIDWAYAQKLMTGTLSNEFQAERNTSRAEGAVILTSYAKTFYGLQSGYTLPAPQTVPPNPYDSSAFALDANGYLTYSAGTFYRGLDVSAHQKEIDWTKVAAAGMDFAMIRAGYRGYTAGTINKDAYFDYNIQNALANGLEVGVYFYSQALTPAEAETEARQLLAWIGDYNVTYPVVFDWEEVDRDDSRSQNTPGNTVTACALAFCKIIEDAGFTPMTYGSPSKIYAGGLALEYLQEYPFWLAHYTKNTAPTSFRYHYDIWQYSSTGRVDGINGNVDLNICLTDWPSRGQSAPPEQPPAPPEIEPPDWLNIK